MFYIYFDEIVISYTYYYNITLKNNLRFLKRTLFMFLCIHDESY